jgi:Domain of unknown function (DUF4304)
MKKLQQLLKSLSWKKNSMTYYIEVNAKYCFMLGFQKSIYSDFYYLNFAYSDIREDKKYKYYESFFHRRIWLDNAKNGEFDLSNDLHLKGLESEFLRIDSEIKNLSDGASVKSFILSKIVSKDLGLNPKQKELIEKIK